MPKRAPSPGSTPMSESTGWLLRCGPVSGYKQGPNRGPSRNRLQQADLTARSGEETGSRSAPIGIPPLRCFPTCDQCSRPDTSGVLVRRLFKNGDIPLQGPDRQPPPRPDPACPKDRDQDWLLGAEPGDPHRHASVATDLLKALPPGAPRPSPELCTNAPAPEQDSPPDPCQAGWADQKGLRLVPSRRPSETTATNPASNPSFARPGRDDGG